MNVDELRPQAAAVIVLANLWPSTQKPKAVVAIVARMLGLNVMDDTLLPGFVREGGPEDASVDPMSLARLQLATVFVTQATTPCPRRLLVDAGCVIFPHLQALSVELTHACCGVASIFPPVMFPAGGNLASLTLRLPDDDDDDDADREQYVASVLRAVSTLESLREFTMSSPLGETPVLRTVPEMPPLTGVNLHNIALPPSLLENVAGSLARLHVTADLTRDIHHPHVDGVLLRKCTALTDLQWDLGYTSTGLPDDFLPAIRALTASQVKYLDLLLSFPDQVRVLPSDACEALESLALSHIGPERGCALPRFPALRTASIRLVADLTAISQLLSNAPRLEQLRVGGDVDGVVKLPDGSALQHFECLYEKCLLDSSFASLRYLETLDLYDLSANGSDSTLTMLASLPRLRSIRIWTVSDIGPNGLGPLGMSQSLEKLRIETTIKPPTKRGRGGCMYRGLGRSCTLQHLQLEDASYGALEGTLPTLQELECEYTSVDELTHIVSFSTLRR